MFTSSCNGRLNICQYRSEQPLHTHFFFLGTVFVNRYTFNSHKEPSCSARMHTYPFVIPAQRYTGYCSFSTYDSTSTYRCCCCCCALITHSCTSAGHQPSSIACCCRLSCCLLALRCSTHLPQKIWCPLAQDHVTRSSFSHADDPTRLL